MDFVIQWLWYLLAFVAGSGAALVIANILSKRTGRGEVRADVSRPGVDEER